MANEFQLEAGSQNPVGTLKELRGLRMSPMHYGSCSRPTETNRGCQFYPCPLLLKLRAKKKPGPEFAAYVVIKPGGAMKQDFSPCWNFVGMAMRTDSRVALYDFLGFGGETTIKMRGSEPLNPKDKKDTRRKRTLKAFDVPAFPRPGEAHGDAADVIELTKDIITRRRERMFEDRLLGPEDGSLVEPDPADLDEGDEDLEDTGDDLETSDDDGDAGDLDAGDDGDDDEEMPASLKSVTKAAPEPKPKRIRPSRAKPKKADDGND